MPSLNELSGKEYWRSLDDLADTPEFRAFVDAEFPNHSTEMLSGTTRRHFLKIMGASLGLAGMTGCRRWPEEKVAPYSHRPEGRMPGVPEHYATAMELAGVASPLLMTSFDGRPLKVEGNPSHPSSRGAASAMAQASVLEMYDPERGRFPMLRQVAGTEAGEVRSWDQVAAFFRSHFGPLRAKGGTGLAILSEATMSPSVAELRRRLREELPQAKWYEYEPISGDQVRGGSRVAFGEPVRCVLNLAETEVIASFGDDLLLGHPDAIRLAADWADGRRSADEGRMNRLYVAESTYTITGSVADHRLAVPASRIPQLIGLLYEQLNPGTVSRLSGGEPAAVSFIQALAADLKAHLGRSVVVAGPDQPPEVHAMVHLINELLGNVGHTMTLVADPEPDRPSHVEAIRSLVADLSAGNAATLLILGGNPVYDAPSDLEFATAMKKAATRIHLSLYDNETSRECSWYIPRAHFLESWGDARTWDGTINVVQPLIEPLYGGKSVIELLDVVLHDVPKPGYDIVRNTFASLLSKEDFEKAWRRVLHDGLLDGSGLAKRDVKPREAAVLEAFDKLAPAVEGLELTFIPDTKLHDGRFANNGWLHEVPDTLTQLTWDNAALVSVPDAQRLALRIGDVLTLTVGDRKLDVPAYILPGQAPGSIAIALGYGRTAAGHVGNGVGFDAYKLRTSRAMYVATGVQATPTGKKYPLACAQDHHAIDPVGFEERRQRIGKLVREAGLEEYKQDPKFAKKMGHNLPLLQLWEEPQKYEGHKWGMAIDLTTCTGCNACVVACQAENNVPIVGKEEVARGREMHWIRIDRYFKGEPGEASPDVVHQPVACHHCENAPCETVCPVAAIVHDTEGLNAMVYNRCVGTRYCSNNCPYKVRRFSFFDYHSKDPRGDARPWFGMPDSQQLQSIDAIRRMVLNPEVTVRMRGVTEKCTYCTQRIRAAKRTATVENRPMADGDVTPACAQTCPTQAIVFGDLNDPNSRVRKLQENNRAYFMLQELNVRPRTGYLARVRNPSPRAAGPAEAQSRAMFEDTGLNHES